MAKATHARTRLCVCQGCAAEFYDGGRGYPTKLCPECKIPKCRGCGGAVLMTWRGGPRAGYVRSGYYCSDDCKPRCSIDGCEKPVRKRGWCANHYAAWHAHGDPEREPAYTWGVKTDCKVCGLRGDSPDWTAQSRAFCSVNCAAIWRKHDGEVPTHFCCIVCGVEVAYIRPGRWRRRSDSAYCDADARHGRIEVSAPQLAAEDGAWCRLCGFVVDMALKHPDPMSATVDHIVPRALGGSDDRFNLQLAHKSCNSSKRHRYVG